MNKILSICTPVFNKWHFTKSYLDDLSRLPNDHQIVIVDNGSTDETQKQLENSKEIIYYRSDVNKGFAWGSNKAYLLATAPNVLFLNNDVRVKTRYNSWTQELIKWCPTHLVGPTMGQLDDNLNFVREANNVLTGNSYMSGWCLAASKTIFDQLIEKDYQGPFSEEYFCYFEDTDLSFRARRLGIPFKVIDLPLVHFGKQTSKQLNTHQLYTQARQIFIKKWSSK